jgi:hypothetical protein
MAKKKHKGIEYRMLIQATYDETLKKHGTSFMIETVKQFSNFSYEIVVDEKWTDNKLSWVLHGLRVPELLMPSFGGAQYRKMYFDLKGEYTFTLKKIDGEFNEITLRILPTSVAVKNFVGTPFVSVYSSETLFEEKRPDEMEIPIHKPDIKRSPEPAPKIKR